MRKRLKLKNDVILELEENGKKHNSEKLKLQDEVLASRQDDTLIQQSNGNSDVRQDKDAIPISSKSKDVTEKDKRNERDSTPKQKQNNAEDIIDVEKLPDKKKVMLIGTSNLKFIDTSMLSNHKNKGRKGD